MDHLFLKVGPLLARCRQYNTCNSVRVEITPAERLAVTLHFFSYRKLTSELLYFVLGNYISENYNYLYVFVYACVTIHNLNNS